MRYHLRTALAAILAVVPGGLAFGQAPPAKDPPPRVGTAKPTETPQAHRAKQVLGAKVSIAGDISIGTVEDLVFSDTGQVEYLIVANEGKLVTVPWEAAKFNFEKQTATVNITRDQYKVIPTYTVREYPVFFAPDYRTEVYRYYGLRPRPILRR
ncbi:MAG TPA: PRC-barrel domain-containing protein [Gemmataceae bacterium]|nr:PRC-barrel domain-containing protein [Gemmataceae bacterium]